MWFNATFYGGRPYRLTAQQRLVSSLFGHDPRATILKLLSPALRSPPCNKPGWLCLPLIDHQQISAALLMPQFLYPRIRYPCHVIHLATAMDQIPRARWMGLWMALLADGGKRTPTRMVRP